MEVAQKSRPLTLRLRSASRETSGCKASNLCDNDARTQWNTGTNAKEWVIFELEEPSLITHIRLSNRSVQEWELQSAFDLRAESFFPLYPRCDAPKREIIYTISNVPCKYLRLICHRGSPIALHGIQAMGIPVPHLEPAFFPLLEHLLPDIVKNMADANDPNLLVLRDLTRVLSPIITHLQHDLQSPVSQETVAFLQMLARPYFPIWNTCLRASSDSQGDASSARGKGPSTAASAGKGSKSGETPTILSVPAAITLLKKCFLSVDLSAVASIIGQTLHSIQLLSDESPAAAASSSYHNWGQWREYVRFSSAIDSLIVFLAACEANRSLAWLLTNSPQGTSLDLLALLPLLSVLGPTMKGGPLKQQVPFPGQKSDRAASLIVALHTRSEVAPLFASLVSYLCSGSRPEEISACLVLDMACGPLSPFIPQLCQHIPPVIRVATAFIPELSRAEEASKGVVMRHMAQIAKLASVGLLADSQLHEVTLKHNELGSLLEALAPKLEEELASGVAGFATNSVVRALAKPAVLSVLSADSTRPTDGRLGLASVLQLLHPEAALSERDLNIRPSHPGAAGLVSSASHLPHAASEEMASASATLIAAADSLTPPLIGDKKQQKDPENIAAADKIHRENLVTLRCASVDALLIAADILLSKELDYSDVSVFGGLSQQPLQLASAVSRRIESASARDKYEKALLGLSEAEEDRDRKVLHFVTKAAALDRHFFPQDAPEPETIPPYDIPDEDPDADVITLARKHQALLVSFLLRRASGVSGSNGPLPELLLHVLLLVAEAATHLAVSVQKFIDTVFNFAAKLNDRVSAAAAVTHGDIRIGKLLRTLIDRSLSAQGSSTLSSCADWLAVAPTARRSALPLVRYLSLYCTAAVASTLAKTSGGLPSFVVWTQLLAPCFDGTFLSLAENDLLFSLVGDAVPLSETIFSAVETFIRRSRPADVTDVLAWLADFCGPFNPLLADEVPADLAANSIHTDLSRRKLVDVVCRFVSALFETSGDAVFPEASRLATAVLQLCDSNSADATSLPRLLDLLSAAMDGAAKNGSVLGSHLKDSVVTSLKRRDPRRDATLLFVAALVPQFSDGGLSEIVSVVVCEWLDPKNWGGCDVDLRCRGLASLLQRATESGRASSISPLFPALWHALETASHSTPDSALLAIKQGVRGLWVAAPDASTLTNLAAEAQKMQINKHWRVSGAILEQVIVIAKEEKLFSTSGSLFGKSVAEAAAARAITSPRLRWRLQAAEWLRVWVVEQAAGIAEESTALALALLKHPEPEVRRSALAAVNVGNVDESSQLGPEQDQVIRKGLATGLWKTIAVIAQRDPVLNLRATAAEVLSGWVSVMEETDVRTLLSALTRLAPSPLEVPLSAGGGLIFPISIVGEALAARPSVISAISDTVWQQIASLASSGGGSAGAQRLATAILQLKNEGGEVNLRQVLDDDRETKIVPPADEGSVRWNLLQVVARVRAEDRARREEEDGTERERQRREDAKIESEIADEERRVAQIHSGSTEVPPAPADDDEIRLAKLAEIGAKRRLERIRKLEREKETEEANEKYQEAMQRLEQEKARAAQRDIERQIELEREREKTAEIAHAMDLSAEKKMQIDIASGEERGKEGVAFGASRMRGPRLGRPARTGGGSVGRESEYARDDTGGRGEPELFDDEIDGDRRRGGMPRRGMPRDRKYTR